MKGSLFLRILLSPFILIYGLFFTAALCMFPLFLVFLWSFIGLGANIFIYLIKLSGVDVEEWPAFFEINNNNLLNHFLGFTLPLWLPFYICYEYVVNKKLFTGD